MSATKIIDDDKLMVAEYFRQGQPHAEWRKLREECPVYWSEPEGFRPYWSITKHADILEVEGKPDVFINAPRFMVMPEAFENYMAENFGSLDGLLRIVSQMDGEEHAKHRDLLKPWFAPKSLAARLQTIEEICNSFFDKLQQEGSKGEADFALDLAFWYPLRVAGALLGIPEQDDKLVLEMAEDALSFRAPLPGEKSGFERVVDFCSAIADQRRLDPKDDLATFLVQSQIDGKPLDPKDLIAHFFVVLTAGHDTTSSAITGGIKALLEHPDQLQMLRAEPSKIASAAEEILRWVTPTVQFCRTATQDYVLRGQNIRKGDSLVLLYSSGNRDAEVFNDPDSFRIDRTPNPHLGFGAGVHSCLGSQLARMEVRCFLKVLLERIEHLELAGPTPYIAANLVTRLERLPVRYAFYQGSPIRDVS